MARYLLFGEVVNSEIRFPRLKPAKTDLEASLDIRLGQPAADSPAFRATIEGILSVAISARTIWVEPHPQARESSVFASIMGPIMAVWLRASRGLLCLHASGVEADGAAVVFVGASGAGKSTLARALVENGFQLLADDLVAIDTGAMTVISAYPELRLWPASMDQFDDRYPNRKVHDDLEKRALQMSPSFQTAPTALTHLFLVEHGPHLSIERCDTATAFRGILANTWQFQLLPGEDEQAAQHLGHVAALLESVPVWRMERTADISELTSLVDAVESAITSPA